MFDSVPWLVVGALIISFLFWSFTDKITNCFGFTGGGEENPKTNVTFARLSFLIKMCVSKDAGKDLE